MQKNLCLLVSIGLFFAATINAQHRHQKLTTAPNISSLACATSSYTASAGTDSCTVTLTAAASGTGQLVQLASSSSAVAVPISLTVPAGANSAKFSANVSAVSTTQSATISATAGGVTKSFTLTLNAGAASLSVNATSIAFGSVALNTPATQSLILQSTGTAAVTISGVSISGTGFSAAGLTTPLTLNPNQTATWNVTFDPATTGSFTGQATVTSTGGTKTISLTGTGQSLAHQVDLTWSAPATSSDPVAGYNVYRAPSGSSSYQQINSGALTQTSYADGAVQSGQTYNYYIKSIDSSGNASSPSNTATAVIP